MIDPKNIRDIIQTVLDDMPQGFKNLPTDLQNNFRGCLHGVFEKLDLVTREEFEAQRRVLLRTREKLEMLERRISDAAGHR